MDISNKLIAMYDFLNNENHISFYKLCIELRKIMLDIVKDIENDEETRKYISLELEVSELHIRLYDSNDFKTANFNVPIKDYSEYFENRIKQSSNPFLLARYNHIMWLIKNIIIMQLNR